MIFAARAKYQIHNYINYSSAPRTPPAQRYFNIWMLIFLVGFCAWRLSGPLWLSGEPYRGHFGMSWGHIGPFWCRCGAALGRLGAILGPSWADLERSWADLGLLKSRSRKSLKNQRFFNDFGCVLEPSGAHSVAIRGPLGAILGSTGAVLGPSGAVLRHSLCNLEALLSHLGAILGRRSPGIKSN